MIVHRYKLTLPVDIDDTLLLWGKIPKGAKTVLFTDPYDKSQKVVRIHEANVKVFRNHVARGTLLVVWSKSGYAWAEAAMRALGITNQDKNVVVMTKPFGGYMDDIPCEKWMGEQIFLPIDSAYGK